MRPLVPLVAVALTAAGGEEKPPQRPYKLSLEFRTRYEVRTGAGFGRELDRENPLFRTRVGAEYRPARWLRLSGMAQDSRAPLYGGLAPASQRDSVDLHEGYAEFFPGRRGFGAIIGRQMLQLGEGRTIGTSDWANSSRTYDTARFYYRLPGARLELILTSLVPVRSGSFNHPVLGDRVWGVYNSFTNWIPKGAVDLYVLRHDRNRPGGFAGPGRLGVTAYGGRATGPLPRDFWYSLEIIAEQGHSGDQRQRGLAGFAGASRRFDFTWPLELSIEYKYASRDYDLLYTAVHDRLGRSDLFGWKNIHNIRCLNNLLLTKALSLSFMYNDNWLDDPAGNLYDPRGRLIVSPLPGARARHVAREIDLFTTLRAGHFTFGAGFTHLFSGDFLSTATPGVNPRYLYVFQTYAW